VSDDHGSYDELADLDEGLLEPSRADEVRAHLVGCAACRARHQALRDVHDELAVLPPETMPPDVAERLDAAFAASAVPRSATVTPLIAQHRRRAPALAGVAAAIVGLGFIAAIVIGTLSHGGGSSTGSASASTASGAAPQTLPSGGAAHFTTTVTPHTYTHADAAAGIAALLAKQPAGGTTTNSSVPGSGAVPTSLRPLFTSPARLLACAAQVAPVQGSVPQAVVFGRYTTAGLKNAPSVFFVFPDGAGKGDLTVVGPTCSGLQQVRDYFQGIPIH
jgi:hypothetical protein